MAKLSVYAFLLLVSVLACSYVQASGEEMVNHKSDNNLDLEKRYRVYGKRYRVQGKREQELEEIYNDSANNDDENVGSESDEADSGEVDKRYRVYGKRFNDLLQELNKRYRVYGKRYRVYGK